MNKSDAPDFGPALTTYRVKGWLKGLGCGLCAVLFVSPWFFLPPGWAAVVAASAVGLQALWLGLYDAVYTVHRDGLTVVGWFYGTVRIPWSEVATVGPLEERVTPSPDGGRPVCQRYFEITLADGRGWVFGDALTPDVRQLHGFISSRCGGGLPRAVLPTVRVEYRQEATRASSPVTVASFQAALASTPVSRVTQTYDGVEFQLPIGRRFAIVRASCSPTTGRGDGDLGAGVIEGTLLHVAQLLMSTWPGVFGTFLIRASGASEWRDMAVLRESPEELLRLLRRGAI